MFNPAVMTGASVLIPDQVRHLGEHVFILRSLHLGLQKSSYISHSVVDSRRIHQGNCLRRRLPRQPRHGASPATGSEVFLLLMPLVVWFRRLQNAPIGWQACLQRLAGGFKVHSIIRNKGFFIWPLGVVNFD